MQLDWKGVCVFSLFAVFLAVTKWVGGCWGCTRLQETMGQMKGHSTHWSGHEGFHVTLQTVWQCICSSLLYPQTSDKLVLYNETRSLHLKFLGRHGGKLQFHLSIKLENSMLVNALMTNKNYTYYKQGWPLGQDWYVILFVWLFNQYYQIKPGHAFHNKSVICRCAIS